MRIRIFLCLFLTAFLAAACASETPTPPSAASPALPSATAPPALKASTTAAAPTEALSPSPLPLATSRGPELHATDPATVSLASGGLQFVEFFRFT